MADNAFDSVAQLIFGRPAGPADPMAYPRGAAASGTAMGFLDHLRGVPTNEALDLQATTDRFNANRAERDGIRAEARDKAAREQEAAVALATKYQQLLAQSGGDSNMATRRLMSTPEFATAFASGNLDKLITSIKGFTAAPIDPGAAVRSGLSGQGSLDPAVAAGGMDVDRNRTPSPLADTLGLDPPQSEALRQSSQLNPAGTANTVATQLQARAFPAPVAEAPVDPAIQRQRADILKRITQDGNAASAELATLTQLRQSFDRIGEDFPSGTWRGIAAKYGLPVGSRTSDIQIAQALLDRLTPAQRQGLPGAASDRDVAMFRSSLPDLMRTAEGNRQILDTLTALAESRVTSGKIAGSAFSGANPSAVWSELQGLPDPMAALEQRRTQRLGEVEGIDFAAVPRMTRPQLRDFNERLIQHYGGPQNIPPRVLTILRRRAQQIDEAGR